MSMERLSVVTQSPTLTVWLEVSELSDKHEIEQWSGTKALLCSGLDPLVLPEIPETCERKTLFRSQVLIDKLSLGERDPVGLWPRQPLIGRHSWKGTSQYPC